MRLVPILIFLAACGSKTIPPKAMPSPAVPRGMTHLDLQPGWRLRVIAGLGKAVAPGGSPYKTTMSGGKMTITVPAEEFPSAYERSYSTVVRRGGCLALRPGAAEIVRKGEPAPITRATVAALPKLPCLKHVRLVYSLAVSDADHQMAIVAAKDAATIDALTLDLQSMPDSSCRDRSGLVCRWIPQGVSVRAEKPSGESWVDAR